MTTTPHDAMPREDADGTAFLSYFAENTSFVWSGSAERPVQVCDGGAGEPVTDVFWLDWPGPYGPGHIAVLDLFRRACDHYLRTRSET